MIYNTWKKQRPNNDRDMQDFAHDVIFVSEKRKEQVQEENKELSLDNFIKELEELSKKYNLYIHSWTNGSGAWIMEGKTKEDILTDLCWNDEKEKYEYEQDED